MKFSPEFLEVIKREQASEYAEGLVIPTYHLARDASPHMPTPMHPSVDMDLSLTLRQDSIAVAAFAKEVGIPEDARHGGTYNEMVGWFTQFVVNEYGAKDAKQRLHGTILSSTGVLMETGEVNLLAHHNLDDDRTKKTLLKNSVAKKEVWIDGEDDFNYYRTNLARFMVVRGLDTRLAP